MKNIFWTKNNDLPQCAVKNPFVKGHVDEKMQMHSYISSESKNIHQNWKSSQKFRNSFLMIEM